jgi:ribosomal protein L7/L12
MAVIRKLNVFLCHASQDKPVVREIYQRLLSEDWIDPWLDEEELLPGQDWNYEIEKALDASDAVIVTLTKGSVSKEGYVQKELRFVLDIALEKPEGTVFILPVRLEECEPPRRLRSYQFADYFPIERHEKVYQRIRASLELRATALDIPIKAEQKSQPQVDVAKDTKYIVKMRSYGQEKINVIKVIRELTNLGLGDAKIISETSGAEVISTPDMAVALNAKQRLEKAGASVDIANSNEVSSAVNSNYSVKLLSFGKSKIDVIKVIRQITNLGLGEAKVMSETYGATVISTPYKWIALDAKQRLESAGAVVELVSNP